MFMRKLTKLFKRRKKALCKWLGKIYSHSKNSKLSKVQSARGVINDDYKENCVNGEHNF
jgi:hypothetical protein